MATTELSPELAITKFADVPDDARRIIYASLLSADDLDIGTVLNSTVNYDSVNGVSNEGASAIRWSIGADDAAALANSCHIHLEVESDFQADFTGLGQRLLTSNTGSQKIYLGTSESALFQQMDGVATNIGGVVLQPANALRKDTHMTIDVIIIASTKRTYIDGVLVSEVKTATAARDFTFLTLFGSQVGVPGEIWGASGGTTSRVKNFYVTTGMAGLHHSHQVSNLMILGDSLMQQGNLGSAYPRLDGVNGTDTFGDYACTARILGRLGNKGIEAKYQGGAVGGYDISDVQTVVDGLQHLANNIVVINVGVNDIRNGTTAGWQAAYQSVIDDITTLGARHIFINTITSTADDTTYPGTSTATDVDALNAIVVALETANPNVTGVDLFAKFGGHSPDLALYVTDNLHWNAYGSKLAGDTIISAILKQQGIH